VRASGERRVRGNEQEKEKQGKRKRRGGLREGCLEKHGEVGKRPYFRKQEKDCREQGTWLLLHQGGRMYEKGGKVSLKPGLSKHSGKKGGEGGMLRKT